MLDFTIAALQCYCAFGVVAAAFYAAISFGLIGNSPIIGTIPHKLFASLAGGAIWPVASFTAVRTYRQN